MARLIDTLKKEIAVVRSYRHAQSGLKTEAFKSAVNPMLAHHEQVVEELSERIHRGGFDPAESVDLWGAVAVAAEKVAAVLGEVAALTMLVELEDRLIAHFTDTLEGWESDELRTWVEKVLLPADRRFRGELDSMAWSVRHGVDPRTRDMEGTRWGDD